MQGFIDNSAVGWTLDQPDSFIAVLIGVSLMMQLALVVNLLFAGKKKKIEIDGIPTDLQPINFMKLE